MQSFAEMSRASLVSARSAATTSSFSVQAQQTPLNQKAFNDLEQLKRQGLNRNDLGEKAKLDESLKKAFDFLKGIVADVNERGSEQRTRRQNRLERLQRDGKEESEEDQLEHEQFQEKVSDLTAKMDESIRQVIDDQAWAKNVPLSVEHILSVSRETQNRRRHQEAENEEESLQTIQPDEIEGASALFHAAQSTADTEWTGQTLTERYSRHPDYSDFYNIRHETQNPGERAPPVPHPDMWFAAQEGRNTQRNGGVTQRRSRNATQNDDDSDVEIEGETISCKCPLTLQYFKNPVTSKKCPHSFEKEAIFGLIKNSREKWPLSPEQIAELDQNYSRNSREYTTAQTQMVRKQPVYTVCPERGCNAMLTTNDFRDNAALQRRARKEEEQERLAAYDDSEDSDDALPRTQRRNVVPITSSPTSGRRRTFVKGERDVSRVPDTQTPMQARGRRQVDVDDVNDAEDGNGDSEDEEE